MFRAICLLVLLLTSNAHALGGPDFVASPGACDCFPTDPTSKKYISEHKGWFGESKVYTCEFTCLDKNGNPETVIGTQSDSYTFSDNGSHFVCRGYTMKYVETPFDKNRMGVMMLEGIRPFSAVNSDIPEIGEWAAARCR